MKLSKTVFRFMLVIMSFLALLTAALFLFQEPGTDGYVISAVSLVVQIGFLLVVGIALYRDWDPFAAVEDSL